MVPVVSHKRTYKVIMDRAAAEFQLILQSDLTDDRNIAWTEDQALRNAIVHIFLNSNMMGGNNADEP